MAETGKPIVKIAIDSEEWDEFQAKFKKYQDDLKAQPRAWNDVAAQVGGVGNSFSDVEKSFSSLNKNASSVKFGDTFAKVSKESEKTNKYWKDISKSIELASKNMSGLARMSISLGALGGIAGALGGFGAALFGGSVAAASNFAGQNITNRRLNLKPGEEAAFSTIYEKAGGNSDLLAKIAAAKNDPSQWGGLVAAGVSQQDIQQSSVTDLAAELLQKGGARYKALGVNGGAWAQGSHVTDFLSSLDLQQAGSYSAADYDKMHQDDAAAVPKLAAQQADIDKGTAAKQAFDLAWQQDVVAFDTAFVKLAPIFTTLSGEAADWLTAFSKSGDLETDINNVVTAFKEIGVAGDWLADKLNGINKLLGIGDGKSPTGYDAGPAFAAGSPMAGMYDRMFGAGVTNGKEGNAGAPEVRFHWAWDKDPSIPEGQSQDSGGGGAGDGLMKPITGMSRNAYFTALEKQQGLAPGSLSGIEQIESSGGKNNVGPVTASGQAMGPFQFMKGTADKYHLSDRMDERQSAAAAALYLKDLKKRYGGDDMKAFAAYNWGEGNLDKDINGYKDKDGTWHAGHGKDWASFLPPETKKYIDRMRKMNGGAPNGASTNSQFSDMPIVTQAEDQAQNASPAYDNQGFITGALGSVAKSVDSLTAAANSLAKIFQDGGGARWRSPDKTSSTAQAPHHIHVAVSTPAGANTVVSAGGLPQ